jgi:hypothetical protein
MQQRHQRLFLDGHNAAGNVNRRDLLTVCMIVVGHGSLIRNLPEIVQLNQCNREERLSSGLGAGLAAPKLWHGPMQSKIAMQGQARVQYLCQCRLVT